MGNGFAKQVACCFSVGGGGANRRRRIDFAAVISEPFDEGLGHAFCYVSNTNPNPNPAQSKFYSISGASVSANASTALSTSLLCDADVSCPLSSAAFDSSTSFASYPLCPIPAAAAHRGFLSGPIDRIGFLSGPLDPRAASAIFSGPLDRKPSIPPSSDRLRRSFSHGGRLIRNISKRIGRSISVPVKIDSDDGSNFQWAQGKAGEDRVHVVVSEEHGWIFVGIYDGFNGPDATDFLLSNLYSAVQRELKGILWVEEQPPPMVEDGVIKKRKMIRWKCDWDDKENSVKNSASHAHAEVLKAMNQALRRTEEDFFDIADKMAEENPELALMGSCVLAALIKGEDVYLMNVGDSRAVLGQKVENVKSRQDLERISEESLHDGEGFRGGGGGGGDRFELELSSTLAALQLNLEHSTCVEEEVRRIRSEHPDDACAVMNDRVKGSLKVTRAFGAGFLKQPKWNDALLEMFRIDYVGTSPYITCSPFLYHHRLGPKDRFLILSSDGLYQYFTNEEAVAEVELFIATTPEGDPAQHLVEEVIFRAAKKAGLDFHELLEIPQGDRRRYHDDVSIIIISFEGRIWRSCV